MQFKKGMLDDTRVIALLEYHLRTATEQTAPGSAHALDLSGLKVPSIRFWTLWENETLLAIGAWKRLSDTEAEVKSMHVAATRRGKGVGGTMLTHLMDDARAAGMQRMSLETGSSDYFRPAFSLYSRHGFVVCGPFSNYRPDPNSIFMTRPL